MNHHAPDVWIDRYKTKVGYEIPFNRHVCVFNRRAIWSRSTPTCGMSPIGSRR